MKRWLLLAAVLLLTGCARSGDRAELECTAQVSGLVTDCVVLSESSKGFGEFAIRHVEEEARCALEPAAEPATDSAPAAAPCLTTHPGSDGPLPRRFQTSWGIHY